MKPSSRGPANGDERSFLKPRAHGYTQTSITCTRQAGDIFHQLVQIHQNEAGPGMIVSKSRLLESILRAELERLLKR